MRSHSIAAFETLARCRADRPSHARYSVRLPMLGWLPVSLLVAIAGVLVAVTCEWDLQDQEPPALFRPTGNPKDIWTLAISADGRRLAAGGVDTGVVIWEVGKEAFRMLSSDRPRRVHSLAFSPDGDTLAAAYNEGVKVVLWNVATGEQRATFDGHRDQFLHVAFSSDGKTLASGGAGSDIRIWDVETARTKAALLVQHGLITALRFSPDGQTLAAGYSDGNVTSCDLTSGKTRDLVTSKLANDWILALSFSPDGSMLATGSMSRGARLWNAATGQAIATFPSEDENVQRVAFSGDGQTLFAVTYSGFVVRRDIATGRTRTLLCARRGHRSCSTPDARFLALADVDAIVKLWDLAQVDCGMS